MFSKVLEKLSPYVLAGGACALIGLLSFSGMFALTALWPLALATMGLAIAYDAEIFTKNNKGALNKLFFVKNYLENHLAKEFLREHFPYENETDCEFFKDYLSLLKELHKFEHKDLDKAAKNKKRVIENSLYQLEQVFRRELFSKENKGEELYPGLRNWLDTNKKDQQKAQDTLKSRSKLFRFFMVFSLISAGFMTLGSTFLISEAMAIMSVVAPIFATIPPVALILIAVVAGVSYGFLTYNAVTDMINNKTLQKFKNNLLLAWKDGFTVNNCLKTLATLLVVSLAVALTLCTAGTWWTIAKEATPLFTWLSKIPGFVMRIGNPIVAGLAALVFNLENTHATLKLFENFKETWAHIKKELAELKTLFLTLPEREHLLQWINPFRIILLSVALLRCVLFLAHLVSIAVTGDRLPGIPEIATTLVGFFAEGFEDAHYFMPHSDEHSAKLTGKALNKALVEERLASEQGHSHANDFPTKVIKFCFLPFYALAIGWDFLISQLVNPAKTPDNLKGRHKLSFSEAKGKITGHVHEHYHSQNNEPKIKISMHAHKAITTSQIDDYRKEHFCSIAPKQGIIRDKRKLLENLQTDLKPVISSPPAIDMNGLKTKLTDCADSDKIATNRHFFWGSKKNTSTTTFLNHLATDLDLFELPIPTTASSA